MSITGPQCRGARGLIGWSQADLCEAAGVGRATLANFEAGSAKPYERTLRDIRAALESAGITFLDGSYSGAGGPGVRLTTPVAAPVDVDDTEVVQYPEYKNKGGVGGSGG